MIRDIIFHSFGPDTWLILAALRAIALTQLLLAIYRSIKAKRNPLLIFAMSVYALALAGLAISEGDTKEPLKTHTLMLNMALAVWAYELSLTKNTRLNKSTTVRHVHLR